MPDGSHLSHPTRCDAPCLLCVKHHFASLISSYRSLPWYYEDVACKQSRPFRDAIMFISRSSCSVAHRHHHVSPVEMQWPETAKERRIDSQVSVRGCPGDRLPVITVASIYPELNFCAGQGGAVGLISTRSTTGIFDHPSTPLDEDVVKVGAGGVDERFQWGWWRFHHSILCH